MGSMREPASALPGSRIVDKEVTVPRYEIRTSKKADAYELEQLRRAFARTAGQCSPAIDTVDVFAERQCLLVAMTIVGSDADVRRDGEQAFAVAWYDAFGRRSSTHVGG